MTLFCVPPRELEFTFVRSSGSGGQNVNKVASKAVLRWNVLASRAIPEAVRARFLERHATRISTDGDVVLSSDRHRDQPRNVADCVERLHAMIAIVARPPKPRRPTKPTRGSKERRLDAKRVRSRTKQQRRPSSED
jgi:ribosome-associated protein